MNNLVFCLMGPTASGKTALACELVERLPCEIISVDSAMIYRGMNIGTAKPCPQTLARAPHHLIDICNPDESYSAAQFCQDTTALCQSILDKGKIPLLVGGTMMYFRALQAGLSLLPEANETIRNQLVQEASLHGWPALHAKLTLIDPVSAQRIHANDTQRIQRALEVYALTGQSLTDCQRLSAQKAVFSFVNLMLLPNDRAWLHDRINLRFDDMLKEGLIDEMNDLLQQWPGIIESPALRCVGYRQVFDYLQGHGDKTTLCMKGQAATRQLAKRQLTWLRNWSGGYRFSAENSENITDVMAIMQQILDNT